jgi:hypothetical protein
MGKLALFDLDNTLLDRDRAFGIWTRQFVETHGLDEGAHEVIERLDADGLAPRDEFFAGLCQALDISTGVDVLLEAYHVEYPANFSVEPETLASIRALRGYGFNVASSRTGHPRNGRRSKQPGSSTSSTASASRHWPALRNRTSQSSKKQPAPAESLLMVGWSVIRLKLTSSADIEPD